MPTGDVVAHLSPAKLLLNPVARPPRESGVKGTLQPPGVKHQPISGRTQRYCIVSVEEDSWNSFFRHLAEMADCGGVPEKTSSVSLDFSPSLCPGVPDNKWVSLSIPRDL